MSDWYYATADGQRHGPLPAGELAALARSGAVGRQTPVWREGLAQWIPLATVAAELGLGPVPPPLSVPPVAAPMPAPAPRSGCLLAVVLGAVALVLVAILGVLAAIALPAYQQYTTRSAAMTAITEARAHRAAVASFLREHGRCPGNDDEGFASAESYAGAHLKSIRFGEFEESKLCGLAASIHAPGNTSLDGEPVWLEYNPAVDTWLCSSAVEDRYLPHECRG